MARFLKNKEAALGKAPGELIFIGEEKVQEATIRVIDYDRNNLSEKELFDIKDGLPFRETETVTWLNINGLQDLELIRQVDKGFDLHALVLQDVLNTG